MLESIQPRTSRFAFLSGSDHPTWLVILSVLTALLLFAPETPVGATTFCDVRKTSDGFVALRAAPDAGARLIARMHAGDEVQVRDDVGANAGWLLVRWWKGGRFRADRKSAAEPYDAEGWVRETLIVDECG